MRENFKANKRNWVGLFLVIIVGFFYVINWFRVSRTIVADEIPVREVTLVQAEAANIRSFFEVFGDSVAALSRTPATSLRNESTKRTFDAFLAQWEDTGVINEIVMTNKEGNVIVRSSVSGFEGDDLLNDTDFYLWAKEQTDPRRYYISKPFINTSNEENKVVSVAIVTPVIEEEFTGLIAAMINLDSLSRDYLGLIKSTDNREVYIIDHEGELVYPVGSLKHSRNIFNKTIQRSPISIDYLLAGKLKYAISNSDSGYIQSAGYFLAYSNLVMDNNNWFVISLAPKSALSDFSSPLYVQHISMLLISIASIVLVSWLAISRKS